MEVAFRRILPDAPPWVHDAALSAALWLGLVLARQLSFESFLLPGVTRMALLWIPTIILLVVLLLNPYRRWWMFIAASMLAALTTAGSTPVSAALVMESMNSGQAFAAAWALRTLRVEPDDLMTIRGMVAFLGIAAFLAPVVFSLASAGLLSAGGWIENFETNWRARSITNVVTALTLGPPLLLTLSRHCRPGLLMLLEGGALLASIPLVEILVTSVTSETVGIATALLYLPILFFLWAALRLGPAGVSLAALTLMLTRVYLDTPILTGLFATSPSEALLTLQLFIVAMATPFVFLAANIQDHRRAESAIRSNAERHRVATAAGRVGAWEWNLVTNHVNLDPSLKAMLGYADHEIANHMDDWGRHVHPGDRDSVGSAVEAHLERGEPFEVEHRMLHKDGSIRWFLARGSVVESDDAGKPVRMMGTDVDVTDRRNIEDALHALRTGINESGRAEGISTFAASVAHEVSQPLSAILANAQACLRWLDADRPDLEEVRETLRDIVGDGQRAGDVIDRTRAMFKRRMLDQREVSIREVVGVSTDIMQRQFRNADIQVTTDCPADLPDVLGDQVQLQQALDNLIANAVESLRQTDHPRSLTIVAREVAEQVRLTVSDSGIGIPERHLEHIFDPFFSTRSDGLGLGLAITHSIVAAHGGSIRAEPVPQGGMSFELLLPSAITGNGQSSGDGRPHKV